MSDETGPSDEELRELFYANEKDEGNITEQPSLRAVYDAGFVAGRATIPNREAIADALMALLNPYSAHGQLCPCWTRKAAPSECDCWARPKALKQADAVLALLNTKDTK